MSSRTNCVLRTLDNPLLNGISLGLAIQDDGLVSLQSGMFPCCSAQGMAWDQSGCGGIRTCGLRSRVQQVQRLLIQYKKMWPQSPRCPHQVPPSWGAQALQELALVLKHDKPQGTLCYSPQRQQPSILWSKAMAASWRFGVEARVLNLQQAGAQELSAFTQDSTGPLALFVEQVDKLWDPLTVEALEFIIQRAYNADAFIWLDFIYDGPVMSESSPADRSLKATFSRKLSKLRNQHPLDYISRDSLSRLQSLCGGPLKPTPLGDSKNA